MATNTRLCSVHFTPDSYLPSPSPACILSSRDSECHRHNVVAAASADPLCPAESGCHQHNVAAAADPLHPADGGSHRRYVAVVSGRNIGEPSQCERIIRRRGAGCVGLIVC